MYRLAQGVRTTHDRDGAVVLDVHRGQMFNLNPAGYRILKLVETSSTESEIASALSREFQIAQQLVENDVREFLETLKTHKLIEDRS